MPKKPTYGELQKRIAELEAQQQQQQQQQLLTEIGKRKQAEQELFNSNERLSALMNALPVGVSFSDDVTCQRITGNPALLAQFEITPSDNISASAPDPTSAGRLVRFFQDGREIQDFELPLQRAVAENREISPIDLEVLLPSGRRWFARSYGAPTYNQRGDVVGGVAVTVDITDRRQAEEELRESRVKLETAFASMTEAIFIADADGRLTDFNDEFIRYHRFKDRAACSKMIAECPIYLDAYFQDGTPAPLEMWAMPRALRGETGSNVEYMLRRKDTGEIWWGSYGFGPIRDRNGRIVGAIVATREITDRKQAEKALRESEASLKKAQEISHLGSWELNLATNHLTWSDEVYRIFGLQPQEFGTTYDAFLERVHPDDRAAVDAAYSGSVRDGRDSYEIEHRVVRKDSGEIRCVQEKCQHVRDAHGRIILSLGMVLDITDRKQAEEALRESEVQFRVLTQNLHSAVAMVDEHGAFTIVNGSFRRMFDIAEEEDILNINSRDWKQWQVFDERGVLMEVDEHPVRKAALTNTVVKDQLVALKSPSSQDLRWLLVSVEPILDAQGKLYRLICTYHDITERKRAEEAREKATALLEAIHSAQSQFIIAQDLSGVFGECLNQLLALMNSEYGFIDELFYSSDGQPHLTARGITDIAWSDESQKMYQQFFNGNLNFTNPKSLFGAVMMSGKPVIANDARHDPRQTGIPPGHPPLRTFLGLPLHTSAKEFVGVIGLANRPGGYSEADVAFLEPLMVAYANIIAAKRNDQRRQQAEKALRESERMYRAIGESINYGVWICDPEGRNLYASDSFLKLVGITQQQCSEFGWGDTLNPDDAERSKAAWKECVRTGGTWDIEHRFRGVDGEWHPVLARGVPVRNEQGQIVRWVGINLDIGNLKRAEEALRQSEEQKRAAEVLAAGEKEFRLLAEAMPQIVWTTRADGWNTYFNHQWVDYTGLTLEESYGHGWNKPFHPEDQQRSWDAWQNAVKNLASYALDCRLRRADGVYRWWLIRGVPVMDEQRNVLKWFGTCTDIEDLKQAEEALQQANAGLDRRASQLRALAGELTLSEQRERSRLAKILHDHLQQLLVAAKFRTAVAGRGGDDLFKQATKEIEELLDESIAASRSLTAELSPPILHEAGLNAGLQWLARRLPEMQGLFVELELEEDGDLPQDIKLLLFESVRELLFNVVKHAHTRSAKVNVRRIDGQLQVIVSDHGVGFDPTAMPAAGEGGKGFGLFSIRERLGLMGGAFEIESTPGQGSRFVLSVPVTPVATIEPILQETLALPEAHLMISGDPDPGQKIRVMLVDDHAVVRQGIANLIGNETDMEVVGQAADGQEAVELAARLLPDVILMDMSMPKLNGVEATRIIHNDWPEIRIIGLSMFEEAERAQAMRDAGAVDYITKSGPAEALINLIRSSITASNTSFSAQT